MEESNKNNLIKNIHSKYLLKQIFFKLQPKKLFEFIKYNKNIQKKLDIGINDYKTFNKIELEIIPLCKEDIINYFIKIPFDKKSYFHIYFNDEKNEIKRNYFTKDDNNIKKIKIIIDEEIKSFKELFYQCICINKINFIKFNRNDIIDMSFMFYGCSSLKELNLYYFSTINVNNMSYMFDGCSSLKELNLNKFDTRNVIDMSFMFAKCSLLKELNLNNFNTSNVTNMRFMFSKCSLLKELNLKNFNTNNEVNMYCMFSGCSDELKMKIKNHINNISDKAFKD